jgi:hypothetical protein
MRLSITVTGLLRTFFSKNSKDHFEMMLKNSKEHYEYIFVVFVISGKYKEKHFSEYVKNLVSIDLISDYKIIRFDRETVHKLNQEKIGRPNFESLRRRYADMNLSCKRNEIPDILSKIHHKQTFLDIATYQFYQLKLGIEEMERKEKEKGFLFDTSMRTRFDTTYPHDFYPHFKKEEASVREKVFFSRLIDEQLKIRDLDDYYENYLSVREIKPPDCRVENPTTSLGGAYYYNKSIKNIMDGGNDIIYCFNDHFFFGKRDLFFKLKTFFDHYGMSCIDEIKHVYAAEAQLLNFCISQKITPIMYLNFHTIIR